MAEQHDKVLKALGVGDDNIKKLNELTPEQLKELKVEDYTTPILQTMQNKFLNDNGFLSKITVDKLPDTILKSIESGQYQRFLKELTDVAQHELGLDVAKFTDEQKKGLKDFFRTANQQYALLKANDPKTLQDLQGKLQTALHEKDDAVKATQTKVDEAVTNANKQSTTTIKKLIVKTDLATLDGYKLKVNPDYILDTVINKLESKYTPVLKSDFSGFELKQKDNDKLAVLKADGTELPFKEALVSILNEDKMLDKIEEKKEEGESEEEKKQRIKIENDGKGLVPSYIQKQIDENIAAEKKAAPTTT